jgi:hypothetical protein
MMDAKADLFSISGDDGAADGDTDTDAPVSVIAGTALRLGEPGSSGAQLSPAQKRFNSLLARIDKLKVQIGDIQTVADAHRVVHQATIAPLRERQRLQMRAMVLWLDERLRGKGMPPAQKRTANDIFCGLCEGLAAGGDEEMRALHDKRSPQSLQEKHRAAAAGMRAEMESFLGQTLDVDDTQDDEDPFEALLGKAREALEKEAEERAGYTPPKKSAAAQSKAAQKAKAQQEDADTLLRKVFRQLASALHPDRERDPAEQKRKTTLMSEANAAYGRQDLVALLHIQLRIEQTGPESLSQMPKEKIEAMSLLLKRQAQELSHELQGRQQHVLHEFNLSPYDTPNATNLHYQLAMEERGLKHDLAQMELDFMQVKDEQGFKDWLKTQKRLMKQSGRDDYF